MLVARGKFDGWNNDVLKSLSDGREEGRKGGRMKKRDRKKKKE